MKIDTHKEAGPTKIVLSILGKFHEAMRGRMRAKCKEILEETFIFFDSPRQKKAKPQDQTYFILVDIEECVFFIWQTFHHSDRTDGESKMHNFIGLFSFKKDKF